MTAAADDNRRKYPRIPLTLEIRCAAMAKPLTFVSRNLSEGGVYVESAQVFPVGAQIALTCRLPYAHGELSVKGTVVRHEQNAETGLIVGMAIEFQRPTATDQQMIRQYIDNTVTKP